MPGTVLCTEDPASSKTDTTPGADTLGGRKTIHCIIINIYGPHSSGFLLATNTRTPPLSQNKGPHSLPTGDGYSSGVGQVPRDARTHLSRAKGHTLGLKQERHPHTRR